MDPSPILSVSFAVLAAMVGIACETTDRPQGAVLVVLDTLRADRLSAVGHDRPTTPHIDGLAERGVLFENAISSSSWTLPAMVGLLSGRLPSTQIFDGTLQTSLVDSLRDAGFATAAFTEGGVVHSEYGLDLGFAEWEQNHESVFVAGQRVNNPDGGIEPTFANASAWLRAHASENFFLFVHSYEVHTPYVRDRFVRGVASGSLSSPFDVDQVKSIQHGETPLGEGERAWLGALYDGGVATADAHVGMLLEALEKLGLAETTLVVVTSDHGEDLGERSPTLAGRHGHTLYDELLRVPLVLYDPTESFAVRRVATQVQLLDVLPTILERLGVAIPPGVHGLSLVGLLRGARVAERPAFSAATRSGPRRFSVRGRRFKLIRNLPRAEVELGPETPRWELYDLRDDPRERRNLANELPEVKARMATQLGVLRRRASGLDLEVPAPGSPAQRRQLEALGYLEPAAPGS